MSDQEILNDLGHSVCDRHFQTEVERNGWDDYGGSLILPMIHESSYLYFYDMWKINANYDKQ